VGIQSFDLALSLLHIFSLSHGAVFCRKGE
jgi:hypothetical protein